MILSRWRHCDVIYKQYISRRCWWKHPVRSSVLIFPLCMFFIFFKVKRMTTFSNLLMEHSSYIRQACYKRRCVQKYEIEDDNNHRGYTRYRPVVAVFVVSVAGAAEVCVSWVASAVLWFINNNIYVTRTCQFLAVFCDNRNDRMTEYPR